MLDTLRALFPQAGDYAQASYWAGLRPMTPDGPPYLGETPLRNLLLNVGQGSNGWTQACGCGRIIADLVSERQPDIDLNGLTLDGRQMMKLSPDEVFGTHRDTSQINRRRSPPTYGKG